MKKEVIYALFPELMEIEDETLRAASVLAFQLAIEKGGWREDTVELVPVTVNWKMCKRNLINHIHDVTKTCIDNYENLHPLYAANGIAFDRDIIIAGALLHDIGKFLEFTLEDGKPVLNKEASLMRHPLSGALLAAQAALPEKIVHLIAMHSFEGDQSKQSAESAFVRSIDDFVFKCTVFGIH
ncbi:HD domain-containing protein [Fusibacter paucivorans]|uniref:HD domain-containing protein n=1 Tax=Fusibacter paucivorans TaxID=76009 RepID=A0ABS5PR09_9FIRM|nr:HD domain-containing protein [Fusibacter paucivorans]MBS7527594.1 HD domain-containing protein [Fusibacter paucivorans]